MSISSTAVWEVRTTGNDANGGMYDASLSGAGTDYSQQDSAQLSVTDAVTTSSTTVTSTTGGFTSAMIGNGINIAGTVYVITARASTNSITVDRTTGTGTGQTAKVGGALATPSKALSAAVGSNLIWVKQGSYSQSSNPTIGPSGVVPLPTSDPTRIVGYATVRGDTPTGATRPTITAASGCTTILPFAVTGFRAEGLILDCNSIASIGITLKSYSGCRNLWVKGFIQYGIQPTDQYVSIIRCEVSGGTAAATAGIYSTVQCMVRGCNVHDNACTGISVNNSGGQSSVVDRNLVSNNTGASSDGIISGWATSVTANTVYGSGRDGIRNGQQYNIELLIQGNLVVNSAAYGLNFPSGSVIAELEYDGNAYYNNTSGSRHNCGTGTEDIILTADPFTAAGSGNFSLNNTSGGGAACRGVSYPGALPGGLTTGYVDIGAVQHGPSTLAYVF